MKIKTRGYFLLFILFTGLTNSGICGKIIRPWRSTTAIVKAGENFNVWFDADNGQTVNSVELKGPYHSVPCSFSIITGDWEYDPLSGNRYNTRIEVTVPPDAPADRYDLTLITSSGNEISYGGVKVVTEFKELYYIMHMSDGHIYQSNYDPITLLSKKGVMIEMANIMDCQIIIETGDNMYNVRNHPEREEYYFLGIEDEGIKGMAKATAATFLVPGDHDAYKGNDWAQSTVQVNSDFFNDYWGLQNTNFKYGNGRFMMLNNAWDVSTSSAKGHAYQVSDAAEWLINDGAGGNFFVTAGHSYDKIHEFIDDHEPLDLVLAGDKHHVGTDNPYEFDTGSKKCAYIARSIRDHFQFNLFKVNNTEGTFTPVSGTNSLVSVLKNGDEADRTTWVPNLTLTYENENDGTNVKNTATIVNDFHFPIEGAKVRFVMPKGFNYEITNASLKQEFEGDLYFIVDVILDVAANSTVEVSIRADDLCPDDPEKKDPGLCGCGIPEGTCPSYPLVVNNGTGDGSYQPLQEATITANPPAEGMQFYTWEVSSGSPTIDDTAATTTTLTLGYESATITASYKEIPKVNSSSFVSQSVPELTPGETITISIIMKNSGTTTWTSADGYKLGSRSPVNNEVWGLNRVELSVDEEIKPNEEKIFTFDITAPSEDGIYILQWQMIQENGEWFGDKSISENLILGYPEDYWDECDILSGWNSSSDLSLNSNDQKQGSACIEYSSSNTDEFKKSFSTPYNSRGKEESTILMFWYYISDVSKLGAANQVEIGSAGKNDQDEYSWSLTDLSNGWNFIVLNVSEATVIGSPDLSAINWFRLYHQKTGSVTTRIDGLQLIDPNPIPLYSLIVNNGSGSGSYTAGESIMIQANNAPDGQSFDKWVINSGEPNFPESSSLVFLTMPQMDVEITATYEDVVSVNDNLEDSFELNIFPNPASDNLHIELMLKDNSDVKILIQDISGRDIGLMKYGNFLHGSHKVTIPVNNIQEGMYLIKVNINDNQITRGIIIN